MENDSTSEAPPLGNDTIYDPENPAHQDFILDAVILNQVAFKMGLKLMAMAKPENEDGVSFI